MKQVAEHVVIVINKTRLEQLVERFNTKAQSKFYIEQSGGDFLDYEQGHDVFKRSLDKVIKAIPNDIKYKVIDRSFLPNYIFSNRDIVIVIGQDGLVANTAKYVKGRPIIAINPDRSRFDGQLLPFLPGNFSPSLIDALEGTSISTAVTMAEVTLNDGQRLLAFNDIFIGPQSHVSARYNITYNSYSEDQSSSGIIVSTGAGSTGWLSSLFNMANGIKSAFAPQVNTPVKKVSQKKSMPSKKDEHSSPAKKALSYTMSWEKEQLIFVVREPFRSQHSGIKITAGLINEEKPLEIESYMPDYGVIFSDGIEKDFLGFNSGSIAKIGIAPEKANIVQPYSKK